MLQKYGKLGALVRWLAAQSWRSPAEKGLHRELTAGDEAMKQFYREQPWDLPLAVIWHLVGYSVGIAQTWLFFHLLRQEASWPVAAGVWFLGMWFDLLTFAVPLNLGALEGTRIVAFKAIGYTALAGMTYGIVIRLSQIFWSGFGSPRTRCWPRTKPRNGLAKQARARGFGVTASRRALRTSSTRPAVPWMGSNRESS